MRTTCVLAMAMLAACSAAPADPVLHLHGHNDYLQPVPLRAALALGLGSVEADVFLQEGQLLVGHERWQLRADRTLTKLYLEPLQSLAVAQGGRIRADGEPFVLLVDIKADAVAVYRRLRDELEPFRGMLTRFADGRVEPGAVTVILSGDRPKEVLAAEAERWCAMDGRLADLRSLPPPPPSLVPWISDAWRRVAAWDGKDELLPDEAERVRAVVARAHEQGREIRFWGAPDRPEAWWFLWQVGVDRIGTDRPKAAAEWLRRAVAAP